MYKTKTDVLQYLGPSVGQLIHFFVLATLNSSALFILLVILVRTIWGLGGNVTTIEGWEIARHEKLLRRARVSGGFLDGPDGIKVNIQKQEFPYDIGIWANIKQGMGSGNILTWIWPFASTPQTSGLVFEVNGFDDVSRSWPPPDPDRIPRRRRSFNPSQAFVYQQPTSSAHEEVQAFKQRQKDDLDRRQRTSEVIRRKTFHDRHTNRLHPEQSLTDRDEGNISAHSDSGEEGWRSPEGDRLADYGVDEEAEFYDQDDIPLSELLRRRRAKGSED